MGATQTETAINACDAVIRFEDENGDMQNIEGESNVVNIDFSKNTSETFTFAGATPIQKTCKRNVSGTVAVLHSSQAGEGSDLMEGAYHNGDQSRTLELNIPDDSVGSKRYSGKVMINAYGVPTDGSVADVIVSEFAWTADGSPFTPTTIVS